MVIKYLLRSVEQHACNTEWALMLLSGPCLGDVARSLQVHPLSNDIALMGAVGDGRGCVSWCMYGTSLPPPCLL